MKLPSWSCVLFPLSVACGAPAAPLVAADSAPPSRASESPLDLALTNRGLTRTQPGNTVPAANWSQVRASLYIIARTREGVVALVGSGAKLHTGERIEFHVSVGRPSYVYLIQVSPKQEALILYPVGDEPARMMPGTDYRLPTRSDVHFELDANVGTERLVLVVTDEALAEGDADVRTLIARLRETGRWTEEAEAAAVSKQAAGAPLERERASATGVAWKGPVHGAGALRGFIRSTTGTGRALDAQTDVSGVALAFFTFDHLP